MERTILLGYMGAGKTTIGKELAHQLGYVFCDLDSYIEEQCQKKIADIFADDGEKCFRDYEAQMLREVCRMDSAVIAVGGGTPCFADNMEYMNKVATTVYVKASVDTLIEHIHISMRQHGSVRPLLHGMNDTQMREYISKNLGVREPFYSKAHHIINIETLRTEENIVDTAKKILLFL